VVCPLCGIRRARRGCPALDKQICSVCCGTKRLVQISCPSDCTWLASAREHPPATVVRQQQRDVGLLTRFMRDLSQGQSELFFLITAFLARYQAPELHAPMDADVAEAIGSLAATFETASRGLIYDHRPASVLAERLTTSLKPVLSEAGQGRGSTFERDAAVVLRRIEEAVRDVRAVDQTNRQAFLDLLRRVMTPLPDPAEGAPERSRLILP
jgi:class 3 adenylate cyclase